MSISSDSLRNFYSSANIELNGIDCHLEISNNRIDLMGNTSALSLWQMKEAAKIIYEKQKKECATERDFLKYIKKFKGSSDWGDNMKGVIRSVQDIYHKKGTKETHIQGRELKGSLWDNTDLKGDERLSVALERDLKGKTLEIDLKRSTKPLAPGDRSKSFGKIKLSNVGNLSPPSSVRDPMLFPKTEFTRIITGDVDPNELLMLGRWKKLGKGKVPEKEVVKETLLRPAPHYLDVFVSSRKDYEKMGFKLVIPKQGDISTNKNNIEDLSKALALKDEDAEKIKKYGAWLFLLHAGSRVAIPTQRGGTHNPKFKEGGYTAEKQREWVTPNVHIGREMRAKLLTLYHIGPDGTTIEWRYYKGKLYPLQEWQNQIEHAAKRASKGLRQS